MSAPVVYDKGKYHDEAVSDLGLPEGRASVHTAFFLGWLMETRHLSEEFIEETSDQLDSYLNREITAVDVYESWDRCLIDDMLDSEGNAFAQHYFDFQKGKYLADYQELLVRKLPSEFHVAYSWAAQATMSARINQRFVEWKARSLKR